MVEDKVRFVLRSEDALHQRAVYNATNCDALQHKKRARCNGAEATRFALGSGIGVNPEMYHNTIENCACTIDF